MNFSPILQDVVEKTGVTVEDDKTEVLVTGMVEATKRHLF